LSTTNPTWPDPGSNPGRRGGKPATNRLCYGAAQYPAKICTYKDSSGACVKASKLWQATVDLHKSPQHPLSLFQPAMPSPVVPCQWLLTVEILQLPALRCFPHRLQYRVVFHCPLPCLALKIPARTI
jgi:hypothetical protein